MGSNPVGGTELTAALGSPANTSANSFQNGGVLGVTPVLGDERGLEIQRWLRDTIHPIESFVIIYDKVDDIEPLRESLVHIQSFTSAQVNKGEKMQMLCDYPTGNDEKHRVFNSIPAIFLMVQRKGNRASPISTERVYVWKLGIILIRRTSLNFPPLS